MSAATRWPWVRQSPGARSVLRLSGRLSGNIGPGHPSRRDLPFYKGVIDYRIPVSICATVTVFALLAGEDPIFHLLAGSVLFAAVYMATDMVTSPITKPGRWIFGVGVAVIIMLIRIWGGYPEGVTFAILLMNAATPLINRWTRPRIYGQGVKVSE